MPLRHYELRKKYLSPQQVKDLLNFAEQRPDLFRTIPANKYGMSTPYQLLDGEEMRKHYPESLALAEPIRKIMEEFMGRKLRFIADDFRNFRIHRYKAGTEGLLWHIDGALCSAIITLDNPNQSGIEVFTLAKSRIISLLVYPLYWLQPLFSWFRPERIVTEPGDMVVLYGGKAVHRTVDNGPGGQRTILALSFREAEEKFSLRAWLLNSLNVTVKEVAKKQRKAQGGY